MIILIESESTYKISCNIHLIIIDEATLPNYLHEATAIFGPLFDQFENNDQTSYQENYTTIDKGKNKQ